MEDPKPFQKLKEIIIDHAEYLYNQGKLEADSASVPFPYDKPAFSFQFNKGDTGSLQLVDNAIGVLGSKAEDVSKANAVRGAFNRFNFYAQKINDVFHSQSIGYPESLLEALNILRGNIVPITIQMQRAIAQLYTYTAIRHLEDYHGPLECHPWCSLSYNNEMLEIDEHAPAEIQLAVEEFNDLCKQVKEEYDDIRASSVTHTASHLPNTLSQRIVRLLQEIIVERSQEIYEEQLSRVRSENAQLGSEEHIGLGNRLIILKDNKLFSANPNTRYPIGWEEIDAKITEFNLWHAQIGSDPETDLNIISKKLLVLTAQIIGDVCDFLKFLTLDDRTDTPEFYFGFSGISPEFENIEADASLPKSIRDKCVECNMLLYTLSEKGMRVERSSKPASEYAAGEDKDAKPTRRQILLNIFHKKADWSDRSKIDECCRQMEANEIPYPRKKGAPSGSDLSKWTELIGKSKNHAQFIRLFGDTQNSTLYTQWRKPAKTAKK